MGRRGWRKKVESKEDDMLKSHEIENIINEWRKIQTSGTYPQMLERQIFSELDNLIIDYFKNIKDEPMQALNEIEEDYDYFMSSIVFRGDGLHLSTTFREEHTSSWLAWILRMEILNIETRKHVFNTFFNKLFTSSEFIDRFGPNKYILINSVLPEISCEKPLTYFDDDKKEHNGELDIFIQGSDFVIVFENKIGSCDLNDLKKNIFYKESLLTNYSANNTITLITILLLPSSELEILSESETFEYFPPVTWESLLITLYETIRDCQRFEHDRSYNHWKSLALAFISFIEGNVLDFNLKTLSDIMNGSLSQATATQLRELKKYHQYRYAWRK